MRLVLRLRPLAFATFLVRRLRIGACGVGACGFWRLWQLPVLSFVLRRLFFHKKSARPVCLSLQCKQVGRCKGGVSFRKAVQRLRVHMVHQSAAARDALFQSASHCKYATVSVMSFDLISFHQHKNKPISLSFAPKSGCLSHDTVLTTRTGLLQF